MKIKPFFLLLLLTSKLTYSQEFVTVDIDVHELVENVIYKLYKGDSLVYSNVMLSDKPTTISNKIDYDSIVFSRVDYETLGLRKNKIEQIIYLTKKTFTIEDVVISSEKSKEIVLGEKNRFVKESSHTFNKENSITMGIVFRNEFKKEMLIDKIAFFVDKIKTKTAYKIVVHKVKEIDFDVNQYAEIGETIISTDTLYLYPKQKNRIEVPLNTDVILPVNQPVFVSVHLIGYYDNNNNPFTPKKSELTRLKFQLSNKFDYYEDTVYHTGKVAEKLVNINKYNDYSFRVGYLKKPHKSLFVAPAVLLHLRESTSKIPVKEDFKTKL